MFGRYTPHTAIFAALFVAVMLYEGWKGIMGW